MKNRVAVQLLLYFEGLLQVRAEPAQTALAEVVMILVFQEVHLDGARDFVKPASRLERTQGSAALQFAYAASE